MVDKEYVTIRITKDIGELIDELLNIKKYGFTSRADVVRAALREFYDNSKKKGMM